LRIAARPRSSSARIEAVEAVASKWTDPTAFAIGHSPLAGTGWPGMAAIATAQARIAAWSRFATSSGVIGGASVKCSITAPRLGSGSRW